MASGMLADRASAMEKSMYWPWPVSARWLSAATAIMADTKHPCRPLTLTMMGGPIDTREAPGR